MGFVGRFIVSSVAAVFGLAAARAHADDPPTFADRPDEEVRDSDRTYALLLNPLAAAVGIFGGEADFVLGRYAALAVEGDAYSRGDGVATLVAVGLVLYPQGSTFHRFYLEPRAVYARPLGESLTNVDWASDAIGVSMTAGFQWTWDYGFTLRLGGGVGYFLGGSAGSAAFAGPQPVLDGSIGWAF